MVRRRAAVARVPQSGLPLSAACVSVRAAARRERAPRPQGARVRARRHRDLRGRRVLRRHRRVRQARRRRRADADHGDNRGARAAPLHLLPQAVVSQRVVVAGRHRSRPARSRVADEPARRWSLEHRTLGARWIFADGGATETALLRERDRLRARVRRAVAVAVRQERDRPRGARRGSLRRQSRPRRLESRAALPLATSSPARRAPCGCASPTTRAAAIDADFDATFDRREHEADRFYAVARARPDGRRRRDPAPRVRRA